MQKVIYTTQYFCELCKKSISVQLFGDLDSSFTKDDEPELVDWARHFHWIDNHRLCAICGKLVVSGNLDLAVNTGEIKIHPLYTNHYEKIRRGDSYGPLLIVHPKCIKKYVSKEENQ